MKTFPVILWLLVWGGMYSAGIYQILSPNFMASPTQFLREIRVFFPILAAYLGFSTVVVLKSWEIPLRKGPLGYLFLYGLTGLIFFFLSPRPIIALYWASVYLSVAVVVWVAVNQSEPLEQARSLIHLNWIIVVMILFLLLLGPLRPILMGGVNLRHYRLPFLGIMTANGVGRFAAIVGLVSLLRLRLASASWRFFWLLPLGGSIIALSISHSRGAILGFALASPVLLWIGRKRWWLVLAGPAVAYLVWVSGFQWRAGGIYERFVSLSGRESVWKGSLELFYQSPVFGYGFHADRLLLGGKHMHNAYLHALLQTGMVGTFFFVGAIFLVWKLVFRYQLFRQNPEVPAADRLLITESIAILIFFTFRSFFESTAAFYGIDLLILAPIFAYLSIWVQSGKKAASANR